MVQISKQPSGAVAFLLQQWHICTVWNVTYSSALNHVQEVELDKIMELTVTTLEQKP